MAEINASVSEEILAICRETLGDLESFTPLHEPSFRGNEWKYVKECIDTGWVSTAGSYVEQFEKKLAEFCGVRRAVATCSGTAALHVLLKVAGLNAGDEVIIPSLTFVATANAVAYCGGIPHFADSEEDTLGIDPQRLRKHLEDLTEIREGVCYNKSTGRPIKILLPVHIFGHPCKIDELQAVAKDFHLALVEDAAESLGSYYKGEHTGKRGIGAALSFNGNKTITTGAGGAVITNDEDLADRLKHIASTAKQPHRWEYIHDEVGYNYRMSNINAALGCAQIESLPQMLEEKRSLAKRYQSNFAASPNVRFFSEPQDCRSNYWLCCIILETQCATELESVLEATNSNQIMTRPIWRPLHQLPMFQDSPQMSLETVESLSKRVLNIPSSAKLAPQGVY